MQSLNALRVSFLIGLAAGVLLFSSLVAIGLGWPKELGWAAGGWIYPPWAFISWWNAWGHEDTYQPFFVDGLIKAGVVALFPVLVCRLLQVHGRLSLDEHPRNEGLGTIRDLLRTGEIRWRGDGVVIGAKGRRIYRSKTDTHVGVLGATRSGKGATIGIPTLLTHSGSVFLFDPKGNVLPAVARRRAELGPVHGFNPTDRTAARFNPLLELRKGDHLIGDCEMAACMLAEAEKGAGPKDPFWDRSAGYLLSGLIYHVRLSADPTLGHIWRLLQDIDLGRYPKSPHEQSARILDAVKRRDSKLRDSMVMTAITKLSFLNDPVVQYAVSHSTFRAGDLQAADTPITVGVAIPPSQRARMRPLNRLVLQSIIMPGLDSTHYTADGRRKRRGVLAKIDEFPSLRYMELMEDSLAESAEYGWRFLLIAQGIEDVYKHYGPNQNITGNCGTIAIMPGLSEKTLEFAVKMAGKRAVAQASKQHSFSLKGSHSMSESETLRNVLDPRELLQRSPNEVLIFARANGYMPTYLDKIRYWEHPAFRGMFDQVASLHPLVNPETEEDMSPWLMTHRC